MRPFALFFLLMLEAAGAGWAQPVPPQQPGLLQRRLQLTAAGQPLGQVLREVSRQSGVSFSYSSTLVPLHSPVTFRTAGAQPLATVLTALCRPRGLSWQLMEGQIVLWRTAAGPPPLLAAMARTNGGNRGPAAPARAGSQLPEGKAPSAPQPQGSSASLGYKSPAGTSVRGTSPARPNKAATPAATGIAAKKSSASQRAAILAKTRRAAPNPAVVSPAVVSSIQRAPIRRLPPVVLVPLVTALDTVAALLPAAATSPSPAGRSRLPEWVRANTQWAAAALPQAARQVGQLVSKVEPLASRLVRVRSGLSGRDTLLAQQAVPTRRPDYYRREAQATLIAPLGTNWLRNGRTSNRYSLNVLAGYAAGVRRLEIGGLLNVVRDTVRGVQIAGLANVVGTATQGLQAAGLVNILGGSMRGVQAAGLANIIRDDARGVQLAGLVNIVGGAATAAADTNRPVRLRRWLGLPRLLATDPAAATPGAASAASLPGPLLQAAGLANLTGTDVRGLQTSPLLNVGRRISGAQLGLVNVARHVRGTQIGLVNIADSVSGAGLLGILNIVRHGGYRRGEVWASETLPLNAVLKLGVMRYYTILGAATQPLGTRVRWAGGFGIGTAGAPRGRFTYSLDLMQWGLTEPGQEITGELRLLTQLRPALAWQMETNGHLQLVVSPTLNLALAVNNTTPPTWDFGDNQLLLLNQTTNSTIWRLWPGIQLGLRF